eukprot:TRINITY_DN5444_c0_g1_i2.p1 TRINITY_DN5444_c0_g1~~TRINITY_DN5444_c0_g1_i2.p1  ORF type:complete len:1218 (+),score=289.45 TRINITY_DN5444_c0_g1_i2:1863-5516(+)
MSLLNYCTYVQWVPESDVVVAQNRNTLSVWYSINNPENITTFPIKGDVQDIQRIEGKTVVIIDEGIQTVHIGLDDVLIQFGAAIETRNYEKAVEILEKLPLTPETEAMWQSLSTIALESQRLHIAERCAAALGNVCRAKYLHKINKIAAAHAEELGTDGTNYFRVRARMELLHKQVRAAERILLDQNSVDEVIDMHNELHRWDEAISVAESYKHPELQNMKGSYYQWLLKSFQKDKAALICEKEGNYVEAAKLYLDCNMPAKAASLVTKYSLGHDSSLVLKISEGLVRAGMFEKAGDLYENVLNNPDKAMEMFKKGHVYRRAVELARVSYKSEVVRLEEEWADWLVEQKQLDSAINHYIEAGKTVKAIETAIKAEQWTKAVKLVETQDVGTSVEYMKRIALHYAETKNYQLAEKYFIQAGLHEDAVEMYTRANKWEIAHRIATKYMNEDRINSLYKAQSTKLEEQGKLKEAEKLLVMIGKPDQAIQMYKRKRQFEQMIRLVATYHKDYLSQTHLSLAQQFESEKNFKKAEQHYIEAKDWGAAVQMYREHDMWDDAMRVAKLHGGVNASKQVAYTWAVSLGGEAGIQLLTKFGLEEQAIDYAVEHYDFKYALEMATNSMKSKLPDVHLKFAMYLEDEGRFKEAEEEFILAGKPREAIDMYTHNQDWTSAERVAGAHDVDAMNDIMVAKARVALERKDFANAESLFLRAKKPELAIKAYKDLGMWNDAIRLTKEYLPAKLREINAEYSAFLQNSSSGVGKVDFIAQGKMFEDSRDFSRAIDAYLRPTQADTPNADYLQESWLSACRVANSHLSTRAIEVATVTAARLAEIQRFEAAGNVWEGVEKYRKAVEMYMQGGLWDKARSMAASRVPEFSPEVERAFVSHLKQTDQPKKLVEVGNAAAGIEMYAAKGEWEKCMSLAEKQGPQVVLKFAAMYASQLLTSGKYLEAVKVFGQYGTPTDPSNFVVYRNLASAVISHARDGNPSNGLVELRTMFRDLMSSLQGKSEPRKNEMERMEFVTHLAMLRSSIVDKGLPEIWAKLNVSMVRYCQDLPADRVFYDAGIACKKQKWLGMAFVFLNRFLDLSELMDENESMSLENADFQNTDIPYDFAIPEKHAVTDGEREEVRNWILAVSMDQQIEQELSRRPCDQCGTSIYEASLSCHKCKHDYTPCIITGYPVRKATKFQCKSCLKPVNRDDWNTYVRATKSCPWCLSPQNPSF